jgi:hypothetical protein
MFEDTDMIGYVFFIESQILEFTNEILSEDQFINIKKINYGK